MREPVDWVGSTPWEQIRDAFNEQCPEGYPMQLVGEAAEVTIEVVNQGIDSRIEVVTFSESPGWKPTHPTLGLHKLFVNLDLPGLLVYLRRLYEYEGEHYEEALLLRGDILSTLGIEEED